MIRQTYLLNFGDNAGTIAHIAEQFATIAKRDNPNFDRDRFLTACGMNNGEWAI
jgi:hypothetical protein